MTKFKVFLQQYIEVTAVMEIEAIDVDQARNIALQIAPEANWQAGDDAYDVECYAVKDMNNNEIWER